MSHGTSPAALMFCGIYSLTNTFSSDVAVSNVLYKRKVTTKMEKQKRNALSKEKYGTIKIYIWKGLNLIKSSVALYGESDIL